MRRLSMIFGIALLSGCSDFALPPKVITADGQTYYACKGYVRSFQNTFGGETYTVEFTNRVGHKVQLRGVSKLTIADMPAYVWAEMPATLPDPKTFKEGEWEFDSDTSPTRAILENGVWRPVSIKNPACTRERYANDSAPTHNSTTPPT